MGEMNTISIFPASSYDQVYWVVQKCPPFVLGELITQNVNLFTSALCCFKNSFEFAHVEFVCPKGERMKLGEKPVEGEGQGAQKKAGEGSGGGWVWPTVTGALLMAATSVAAIIVIAWRVCKRFRWGPYRVTDIHGNDNMFFMLR